MIDYLTFDYDDQEEIELFLNEIKKEIKDIVEDPVIAYKERNKETRKIESNYVSQTQKIRESEFSGKINEKCYISKMMNELKNLKKHEKEIDPNFKILGLKRYSESKKEEDKYDEKAKINTISITEKLEDINNYLKFSLVVLSNLEKEKRENSRFFNDSKIQSINSKIEEIHAIIENLEYSNYMLSTIKQNMLELRNLKDIKIDPVVNEYTVQYHIMEAKSHIENFAKKLTTNERRQNIFNSCEIRQTLKHDNNVINILLDSFNNEKNKIADPKADKLNNFIQKINESNIENKASISQFINEEKSKNYYQSFFDNNKNYSLENKIAILEILKLSLIETEQELQDCLTYGNKEIKIEKDYDGTLDITIRKKASFDKDFNINSLYVFKEDSILNNKADIIYKYDPQAKKLRSVTYKDNANVYELNMETNLGKNIKTQFSVLLGAIEGNLSVEEKSFFKLRVPFYDKISLKTKGLLFNLNLESYIKKIKTEFNSEISVLNNGLFSIVEPITTNNEIKFSNEKASITLDINSLFNLNLKPISDLLFYNVFSKIESDKIKNLKETIKEPIGRLSDAFYSFIQKDKQKAKEILNVKELNNSEILEKYKSVYYEYKNAEEKIEKAKNKIRNNKYKNAEHVKDNNFFENIIDKIGEKEKVTIDEFNSRTLIDGKNQKTIDREIKRLFGFNILNEDLKDIRELFLEVENPLIYKNYIYRAKTDNEEVKKSIENIFFKISKDYIKNVIKEKKIQEMHSIIKDNSLKSITMSAIRESNKNDVAYIVCQLKEQIEQENKTLDEIIKENKKIIEKFSNKEEKEIER